MEGLARARRLRFGIFETDLPSGELRKHGLKIRLQDQPFQILLMLLERPREVVTREELRQKLWSADTFVDFDVGLNTAVKKLRDALGDDAENPRFVETVPRHGYRFIAPVESDLVPAVPGSLPTNRASAEEDLSALPALTTPTQPEGLPAVPAMRRGSWHGLSVGLLLLAGVLALFIGFDVGGVRQRLLVRSAPPSIQSIAVLPFDNLTGDPGQEYLVDGITDSLITELAQLKSPWVISRTSVQQYKGVKRSLPQIAKELHVDAVIEGTVRRAGDRVWITPQLIEAATDRHLWAKPYERDLRDVQALQNQVARDIVHELRIELSPQEQSRLANARPVNPEAYEAYLKGRYYWNKRTYEGAKKGREYFEQAIQKDPNYAPAYAGLADSYTAFGGWPGGELFPLEETSKARAATLKALELDGTLAEAHASLAGIKYFQDWDWAGAEEEYLRAIEPNPGYATAYLWYGNYLYDMGRPDEALAKYKHAQQLDPLSPTMNRTVGLWLARAGQYDQAIQQYQKALDLDPDLVTIHRDLGTLYRRMGRYEQSIAELQKAIQLSNGSLSLRGVLAHAYAVSGKRAEAEKILDLLKKKANQRSYLIAEICVGLGRKDEAFKWLQKAYEEHLAGMVYLKVDSILDPLRSDPRFQKLLGRMGFPPDEIRKSRIGIP